MRARGQQLAGEGAARQSGVAGAPAAKTVTVSLLILFSGGGKGAQCIRVGRKGRGRARRSPASPKRGGPRLL